MDDGEIISAVRGGDREAFAGLVERYQPMVLGVCRRIAGNPREAEELAHDAFVEAYLKIDTLREPARMAGWLRTLTLNLCRMWIRRRKSRWAELPEDAAATPVVPDEDPAMLARMAGALAELPAPQRLVLVLHYFEELSYEQIAEFLEVPAGTVMSRLHRARQGLRRFLAQPVLEEEPPMHEDERFTREVQAEIRLLLEMFRAEPSAAQRLTVILRHSPRRLADLVAQAEHDDTLADLAMLLPRLGQAGVAVVVEVALSGQAGPASRAAGVLREMVRQCRSIDTGGWQPGTPCPAAYVLMQAIIEHAGSHETKAELLLELLGACEDEAAAALVSCVLLCYPGQAIPLLLEWFRSLTSPEQLHGSPWLLHALCRTGRRFCGELVTQLGRSDVPGQIVALAGLEAVGRCLEARGPAGLSDEEFADDVRARARWPMLRAGDIGDEMRTAIQARAAELLASPRPDLRNGALAVLGRFRADAYAEAIAALATHEDLTTRLAAVHALAAIGEAGAAWLLRAAEHGEPAERRAAIEAIGRHRMAQALPLLLRMVEDGDSRVRQASAVALGQIGTAEAHAALRNLLTSDDRPLQKAAAKALYRPAREADGLRPSRAIPSMAARIREGARPTVYSAVHTVLRSALPEVRPYDEPELTRRIAAACIDYSLTRRRLVDEGWMTREAGVYELTDIGRAGWQVERFVREHYLT